MRPTSDQGVAIRYTKKFRQQTGSTPRKGVLVGQHPTVERWAKVRWEDSEASDDWTDNGVSCVAWDAIKRAR